MVSFFVFSVISSVIKLTSLEKLDLVHGILLLATSLLQLGNLDLLSKLLEISLSSCFGRGLFARRLINQLALDLAHVLVALDHLGKVVCRARERHAFLLEQTAGFGNGIQGLLVEGEFAVEVVVNVGDVGGCVADDDLVLGKGELGGEGKGLYGAQEGGCVVDGKALVRDNVALVL